MSDRSNGDRADTWFGHERSSLTVGGMAVDVVTAPSSVWSDEHQRRLLETRAIDGLVPTLAVEDNGDSVRAFQLPSPGRSFADAVDRRHLTGFEDIVSVAETASEAVHAAHLVGLVHGALSADDILLIDHLTDDEVAVWGMGLGLGGSPEPHRRHFAAPEVVAGGQVTVRSDVFGLGRVLEAGLGRLQGSTPHEAAELVAACTHADPRQRPPSAHAVADRLGTLTTGRRRHRPAALGSTALAAALAAEFYDGPAVTASPAEAAAPVSDEKAAAPVPDEKAAAPVPDEKAAAPVSDEKVAPVSSSPGSSRPVVSDRRRRAVLVPILLSALVAVGLWAVSRDGSAQPDSASATTGLSATTGVPATAPPTSAPPTSGPTTSGPATSGPAPTGAEQEAPDEGSAGADETTSPSAGLLSAVEASTSFELLHALPNVALDVYVAGRLAAPGFVAGTLAGPLPLSAVGQPLDLFLAVDDPPISIDDRSDVPILAGPISLDGPGTLVVFVDEGGTTVIQPFGNNLAPVAAGHGRLSLRHVAAVGRVSIDLDGERLATSVPPGSSVVVDIAAGSRRLDVTNVDGDLLLSQEVDVIEGELTSAWIRGGDGTEVTTSIRRISGLESAPSGIPSGNAGLAAEPKGRVGEGIAPSVVMMAVLGGLGLYLQHRRRSAAS